MKSVENWLPVGIAAPSCLRLAEVDSKSLVQVRRQARATMSRQGHPESKVFLGEGR